MKRKRSDILEEESRTAFKKWLPSNWIKRDIEPDKNGIDMEVTIVENEDITNKVVWFQLKSTDSNYSENDNVSLRMDTNHLKYYEQCRLPIIVVYFINATSQFRFIFAQKYIRETLSRVKPNWKEQKTITIRFAEDTILYGIETLNDISSNGYYYLIEHNLNDAKVNMTTWLDGIPYSDNNELKERFLKALLLEEKENHSDAIWELEEILRIYPVNHSERLSLLLNLGNAHYFLGEYGKALRYYQNILDLSEKVDDESSKEGRAKAIGNIGVIHYQNQDLNKALHFFTEDLDILNELGNRLCEANQIGNIGLIFSMKGDYDKAIDNYEKALNIFEKINNPKGVANTLGNIGLAYNNKGDYKEAIKFLRKALKIDRRIGYKQGVAEDLGTIGIVFKSKGSYKTAIRYLSDAIDMLDNNKLTSSRDLFVRTIEEIHNS